MIKKLTALFFSVFISITVFCQTDTLTSPFKYSAPKEYEIGDITVSGIKYLDKSVLIQLTGLEKGKKITIPGEKITMAIQKLWKHGLFSDVKISATKIEGNVVYLDIYLQERPRLNSLKFIGVKTSEADDLKDKIKLIRGTQITENVINNTENIIRKHFTEKGYLKTKVTIVAREDSTFANTVNLKIYVDKYKKLKIKQIDIVDNQIFSDKKVRRYMKKTKQINPWRFYKRSKFVEADYEEDKKKIIEKYNEKGYRDAEIVFDSIFDYDTKTMQMRIKIFEGKQYFFRNISWVGNTKYSSEQLNSMLKIKKGDVFDQALLDKRLSVDPDAVGNLYLDDGYLFYSCTPVERLINNDSIDLEMRIFEGKQATIDRVTIKGNTKTNDHVVFRELYTKPGELFSRSKIIRSVRELANLGHFNPEKIAPAPLPKPAEGTVDLDYSLEERANDQVEISGGYGAGMVIGSLGLSFNNFSTRNIFKKDAWQPLPTGDGQKLSLRGQTTGPRYQSYSISFTEPWLGGKRPNSLSLSLYHSVSSPYAKSREDIKEQSMITNGASVGLGRRLSWPDDYFTLYNELGFKKYELNEYPSSYFPVPTGDFKSLSYNIVFGRNSIDNPLYSRRGSNFSLGLEITPPYSLLDNKDYKTMDIGDKHKWIEYHKWSFAAEWFTPLYKDLVLRFKTQFGHLGYFNQDKGVSPFEGYTVGGSGMSGSYYNYGSEIISLRGYEEGELTDGYIKGKTSIKQLANVYDKFTLELRYPVTLSESATIYGLLFLEAGNAWFRIEDFNPFSVRRSAGFGARVFLPMLGLLGFDMGYAFDPISGKRWQPHFIIGQQF